jgi:hypothetical protein
MKRGSTEIVDVDFAAEVASALALDFVVALDGAVFSAAAEPNARTMPMLNALIANRREGDLKVVMFAP